MFKPSDLRTPFLPWPSGLLCQVAGSELWDLSSGGFHLKQLTYHGFLKAKLPNSKFTQVKLNQSGTKTNLVAKILATKFGVFFCNT